MDPADVGVDGDVAEAGVEIAGGFRVAERAGQRMSQIWRWGEGPNNWGGRLDQASAGSTGRRRRHGTLQSVLRGHGDLGG